VRLVGEDDALVNRPQDVTPMLPIAQAHESGRGVRTRVRAVQERQENEARLIGSRAAHELVGPVVDVSRTGAGGFRLVLEELLDEPLQIAGRSGAGLDHQVIAGNAIASRHEYLIAADRRLRDVLIDAPRAENHAHLAFIQQCRRKSARVDVKQPSGHRRSLGQSGPGGGLGGDAPANIGR